MFPANVPRVVGAPSVVPPQEVRAAVALPMQVTALIVSVLMAHSIVNWFGLVLVVVCNGHFARRLHSHSEVHQY